MTNEIEKIISDMKAKDASVLCREVLSIGDTMDVIRSKWTVEILTAILCGNVRFKDILSSISSLSDKVLTDRLRQMVADRLLVKKELYGYPPRVEYEVTEHGKSLYAIVYSMTEWGQEHRRIMLGT